MAKVGPHVFGPHEWHLKGQCSHCWQLGLHLGRGWTLLRPASLPSELLLVQERKPAPCRVCEWQSLRPRVTEWFGLFPRSLAIKEFFSKPKYNHILKPEDCLSEPCTILQLDMRTVQIADLEVRRGILLPQINDRVPAPAGRASEQMCELFTLEFPTVCVLILSFMFSVTFFAVIFLSIFSYF